MLTLIAISSKLQIALPQGPNYVDINRHYRKSCIANRPFWRRKKTAGKLFCFTLIICAWNIFIKPQFYVGGHNRFFAFSDFCPSDACSLGGRLFHRPLKLTTSTTSWLTHTNSASFRRSLPSGMPRGN